MANDTSQDDFSSADRAVQRDRGERSNGSKVVQAVRDRTLKTSTVTNKKN